tara:strand:- start:686 stop:1000 length:315 start_codon:yes stop_codon:yes gene_type:complete
MKFFFIILLLLLFNSCAQNTALLGPAYTLGTTGNAFQAGVSYGTSYVVKKATGKTTSENVDIILKKIEVSSDTEESVEENPENFFKIVKKHVEEIRNVNTSTAQ